MKRVEPQLQIRIVLFLIFLLGGFLRFYNLNWDEEHMFHPDERNIANAVTRISVWDQMDPGFFAYGGLTIYLYKITADNLVEITNDPDWTSDWGKINHIGRFYSALFSTVTILTIFYLGKKIFDEKVGLLASCIFAFTVFSIQSAHYSTTESMLGLFATLLSITTIWMARDPKVGSYFTTGTILGIAIAAKTTSLSFVVFPALAIFYVILRKKIPFMTHFALVIILFSSALSIFSLLSPYTFLSWQKFNESMIYEGGVVSGSLPVPYTLQFTNTLEYIFQLQNLFWQMGVVAACSLLGYVLLVIRIVKKREIFVAILLSFPTAYFIYVGGWHAKFIRYMAPLLPFFAIFASYMLWKVQKKYQLFGEILISSITLFTILWALAFFTIYTQPQTRIVASHWIYENIPAGSKILGEHWDDGLPVGFDHINPSIYSIESLEIYQPDNDSKRGYYAQKLSSADYIVINSRRLYGTLLYLPEQYPLTKKYYELLFAEKLGYHKVAEFSSYPRILNFSINDDFSEETFQVYEHPKVLIFKNTDRLTYSEIWETLH